MYSRNKQSGVVLLVSLLILLVITLVGFSVMATSNLEVKMASTKELKAVSYQAAEAIIDEVLTEPTAVNILGQSLNAYLADPNDPSWPNDMAMLILATTPPAVATYRQAVKARSAFWVLPPPWAIQSARAPRA